MSIIRGNQDIIGTLIFGGVFERHPELKVVCVEADAGWVPHYMYRMDHAYKRHRNWLGKGVNLSRLPSEYFADHIYTTFQDDWVAFRSADQMNWRRLMWANDFPHSDSTWPWSQEMLAEQMCASDARAAARRSSATTWPSCTRSISRGSHRRVARLAHGGSNDQGLGTDRTGHRSRDSPGTWACSSSPTKRSGCSTSAAPGGAVCSVCAVSSKREFRSVRDARFFRYEVTTAYRTRHARAVDGACGGSRSAAAASTSNAAFRRSDG